MIENFNVRKELFEDTPNETLHFELTFEGKEYQGLYKEGEVSWFQMHPDQEIDEMKLKELEVEVRKLLQKWEEENK